MSKLGDFIKSERIKRDLGLREFARKVNISHSYLDILEKGYDKKTGIATIPSIDTLAKIANAFNMDLDKLLFIAGYTNNENSLDNTKEDVYSNLGSSTIKKEDLAKNMEEFKRQLMSGELSTTITGIPLTEEEKIELIAFANAQLKILKK